jgi:Pyridoxamine 5'-phosphate oxidase
MAKLYDQITDHLAEFIQAQPLFFVATAPLAADGHVNLSPKGLDCLRILSPTQVAYLDLTGSGNETSAHLRENGRVTLMFCAFSGPPNILRLYGRGRTILPDTAEWDALRPLFPEYPGARQIIAADIARVQTSCGFAVPRMDYVEQRDTLLRWASAKGEDGVKDYHRENNLSSIDGLPAPLMACAELVDET